ncbi:MAG TPA: septum site-determining protein Ssd [Pseudonocardiaceae bacterium]|nr:septum site-determining protein Ssd [Pseudonocardiaceae bacterium]
MRTEPAIDKATADQRKGLGCNVDTDLPLVMCGEESLLDELLRLAAAAGCELHRVPDAVAARRAWATAPLILLDESAARACIDAELPRRERVLITCGQDPPPDGLWPLAVRLGAVDVVPLPTKSATITEALADAVDRPSPTEGRILAVLGGRGGAGASVFAAAVAMAALRRGDNALLVDCDPLGGGIDLVLGAEAEVGLRWPELRVRGGRIPVASLRSALPGRTKGDARLTMVSCDRDGPGPEPEALAAVLQAGRRAGETVICDLPRSTSEVALLALDRADLTVLVVPAEVRASAAARRMAEWLTDRGIRAETVVRGPAPGGLRPADVANAIGLPLVASMRPEPKLASTLERGVLWQRATGPLAAAATAVLDVVCTRVSPVVAS